MHVPQSRTSVVNEVQAVLECRTTQSPPNPRPTQPKSRPDLTCACGEPCGGRGCNEWVTDWWMPPVARPHAFPSGSLPAIATEVGAGDDGKAAIGRAMDRVDRATAVVNRRTPPVDERTAHVDQRTTTVDRRTVPVDEPTPSEDGPTATLAPVKPAPALRGGLEPVPSSPQAALAASAGNGRVIGEVSVSSRRGPRRMISVS